MESRFGSSTGLGWFCSALSRASFVAFCIVDVLCNNLTVDLCPVLMELFSGFVLQKGL
jgi:hypothetical protein